jgi:hypothetical protein
LSFLEMDPRRQEYVILQIENHTLIREFDKLGFQERQKILNLLRDALKYCRLNWIEFQDGGYAHNLYDRVIELMLRIAPAFQTSEFVQNMKAPVPAFPDGKRDIVSRSYAASADFLNQNGFEGAKFIRVQGRTLIYEHKGEYIALKLLKENEDAWILQWESDWQAFLHGHREELNLESDIPEPVGKPFQIPLEGLSRDEREALEGVTASVSGPHQFAIHRSSEGNLTAMAYRLKSPDYFQYLNDDAVTESQYIEKSFKGIRDLMKLARFGWVHTAL